MPIEVYRKPFITNRYIQKTSQKQNEWIWTQEHTEAFNTLKRIDNTATMLTTLQFKQRKYSNNRHEYKKNEKRTAGGVEKRKESPMTPPSLKKPRLKLEFV